MSWHVWVQVWELCGKEVLKEERVVHAILQCSLLPVCGTVHEFCGLWEMDGVQYPASQLLLQGIESSALTARQGQVLWMAREVPWAYRGRALTGSFCFWLWLLPCALMPKESTHLWDHRSTRQL